MFLEVIALHAEDVVQAQHGGADRIELVSAMEQAGLSPTIETIKNVLAISEIPIRIMVRFHNNGFVYTKDEKEVMYQWMHEIGTLPFDGYVIGAITADGLIDEPFLKQIINIAKTYGKNITFHRAFDTLANQIKGLKVLEEYGVQTVLTSAGYGGEIIEKIDILDTLQRSSSVEVLAGGGVTSSVIEKLGTTTVQHAHVGSAVRQAGDFELTVDMSLVRKLKEL